MTGQTEDWVYVGNTNRMYQHIPPKFLSTQPQQESEQ